MTQTIKNPATFAIFHLLTSIKNTSKKKKTQLVLSFTYYKKNTEIKLQIKATQARMTQKTATFAIFHLPKWGKIKKNKKTKNSKKWAKRV